MVTRAPSFSAISRAPLTAFMACSEPSVATNTSHEPSFLIFFENYLGNIHARDINKDDLQKFP